MAKKLAGTMKLQVPAGQANPSPPVGPALGQRGINIMEFCKAFNAKTADMEQGAPCPTVITYYQGQVLHHGHQDAARVLLPEKSGWPEGLLASGTALVVRKTQVVRPWQP